MVVLGIEGTAWSLSVGVVRQENGETEEICEVSHPYIPERGGIHPREAAQHHSAHIADLLRRVFERVSAEEIDAIAFSQGPGLGPCLRVVATASRTLSLLLKKPLVGVNHCIAHIEIGKWETGAENPLIVYASGANTQILALKQKRYRIFGETIDVGLGNALDKFAREIGLSHPGGPKIEELAKKSSKYIELPYTVKGMDLAFSGLLTSALRAVKENPVEDVCFSLQEVAFAMLTEVSERALAHTSLDEVMLVGGVGANDRLSEMLSIMCEDRGVSYYRPAKKYLGDNGTMIAYLGLKMFLAGIRTPLEESGVIPGFRPEMVEVVW
ncbi:bifunctional N(6)-L-threonylcarbamoyladenine synthase/serine/threonine protein kinase [Methanosarcinales archaeon]|nr:MAG: bifunctional N(6)-L-threonylcarbamoyladenine synthase/serine/threonine protein kinase [Methanosarcinales archaeon]